MDLAGAKYFSSLDTAQAFHNIPVKPESQALTASSPPTACTSSSVCHSILRTPGPCIAASSRCFLTNSGLTASFCLPGRHPHPHKDGHMKTIKAIKAPTSGKELQQLVGFLQYFSSFVPGFSQLTAPMNALRNKRHVSPWDSMEECKENLQKLKDAFAKPIRLRHYLLPVDDPDARQFEVHMDFSAQGLAACLYQMQRIDGEAKLQFINAAG